LGEGCRRLCRHLAHVTRFTTSALIDGKIGVIAAPDGHLLRALSLKIKNGKITEIEIIGNRRPPRRTGSGSADRLTLS
jgi:hypothetical protein